MSDSSADRTIKELNQIQEVSEADTLPIWDESLGGNNTRKVPVGMLIQSLIDFMHPVGSLYISELPTEPRTIFGGVWEKLPDGVFIRNSGGNAGEVGQIQPEGLPNIKATVSSASEGLFNGRGAITATGGFSVSNNTNWAGGDNNEGGRPRTLTFDASKGETKINGTIKNDVYNKSDHVTPYNVSFHMWKRIS